MNSYNVFKAGDCSDHLQCRIYIQENERHAKRKPLKFVNATLELDEFKPLAESYWKETEPIFLSTSSLFRFSKNFKAIKPLIRNLAKEKMGNLTKKTNEAYSDICNKQELNLRNPSPQNMEQERGDTQRWKFVAGLEENLLKQRSKMHWLKVGDQNNKSFHRAVVTREMVNTIREVRCRNGVVVRDEKEIKEEAVSFFKDFLRHVSSDYEGMNVEDLQELLPFRCSEFDSQQLMKPVSTEEIKSVLFAMSSNKSPGPNGFKSEFFKSTWDITGVDFVTAVQALFVKGLLPKGINSMIVALILKKTEALEMKDYRPISCCNVIYKVISKLIANRLKVVLPQFIAANQSVFVQERLLIENLLLATELVKDYHRDTMSARCAIKIDISKAFDSVQWSFS